MQKQQQSQTCNLVTLCLNVTKLEINEIGKTMRCKAFGISMLFLQNQFYGDVRYLHLHLILIYIILLYQVPQKTPISLVISFSLRCKKRFFWDTLQIIFAIRYSECVYTSNTEWPKKVIHNSHNLVCRYFFENLDFPFHAGINITSIF